MPFAPPELKPYQKVAQDFIVDRPHCGIYLGMGGGKSLTTLSALAQVRPSGHILVAAPINIARSTWIDEIEKWGFPLRTKSLIVNDNDVKLSREKRMEAYAQVFQDKPTMYFINRELIPDLIEQRRLVRLTDHVATTSDGYHVVLPHRGKPKQVTELFLGWLSGMARELEAADGRDPRSRRA